MKKDISEIYGTNPIILFQQWLAEAEQSEINDPTAMAMACIGLDGSPTVRMVLLKTLDERGFVFCTNYESDKARALLKNPHAALNFHWKSLHKQVRITGTAEKTDAADSDLHFNARARESRIGAWASQQSRSMENYETLEKAYEHYEHLYQGREDIPRPPHWGGFRIKPERIEFWLSHPHRLHTRFVYIKEGDAWSSQWLYP